MINTNQRRQKHSNDSENSEFSYNYHPVFDTALDLFENIKSKKVIGQISLLQYLDLVRYRLVLCPSEELLLPEHESIRFEDYMRIYLTNKYENGSVNAEYKQLKENNYPAVCFNAKFHKHKELNNLKEITNLMFLDIDGFTNQTEALEYREIVIKKYPWIVACTLSISKIGLHIIILVDEIINNNDFNEKYQFISDKFFDSKLDKNAKSLTRYTIIPFDYELYINYYPSTLLISKLIEKKSTIDVYNKQSQQQAEREEILCNNCTFFNIDSTLDLKQYLPEDRFIMANYPEYIYEGIYVVDLNLYYLKNKKINEGSRNSTLGSYIKRLIYINGYIKNNKSEDLKTQISKFIYSLNANYCNPPLASYEVDNLLKWNWNKYIEGTLVFDGLKKIRRVFWSRNATLKGKEKRDTTYRARKPVIERESKKKIAEAIKQLKDAGKIIDQKSIAEMVGKSVNWVKMYWGGFKEEVKEYNTPIRVEAAKAKRRKS